MVCELCLNKAKQVTEAGALAYQAGVALGAEARRNVPLVLLAPFVQGRCELGRVSRNVLQRPCR